MKSKQKEFSEEEIKEINVLDILQKEQERSGKGMFYENLSKLFDIMVIPLVQILEKLKNKGLIKEEKGLFSIKRKGRIKLREFLMNAKTDNQNIFRKQRPLIYYNSVRLSRIEEFFGFSLFFILLTFILVMAFYWSEVKGVTINTFSWLILLVVSLLWMFSIMGLYLMGLQIMIRGVGSVLKKAFSDIGDRTIDYCIENPERVSRVFLGFTIFVIIIILLKYLGILGLITGILLSIAFLIITNFKNISFHISKIFRKLDKRD